MWYNSLLTTQQSFHSLMRAYEKSMSHRISYNDERLAFTNKDQVTLLSSRLPPRDKPVEAFSFPWLSELRRRSNTIDFLVNHDITKMDDHANAWPTLVMPKIQLQQRLTMFKRQAFLLLYKLAGRCCVRTVSGIMYIWT
jgi:hypothetical protein